MDVDLCVLVYYTLVAGCCDGLEKNSDWTAGPYMEWVNKRALLPQLPSAFTSVRENKCDLHLSHHPFLK